MQLLAFGASLVVPGCASPYRLAAPACLPMHESSPDVGRAMRDGVPPVRVQLLDCEVVEPVGFEETLPDGRVFAHGSDDSAPRVRLYLQVESRTDRPFVVAFCGGGLAVVPLDSRRPFCGRFGDGDWILLEPHTSVSMYPAVDVPTSSQRSVTETLLPRSGHAPVADWPRYKPNPVSFELTPTGCAPTRNAE